MCYATGFALALVLGALLPWRWAVGSVLICPFGCFFLLLLCPESPVWYLTKGQDDLAKQSLIKLRGEDNMDIVEAEFNRINLNLKIMEKEEEINAGQEQEGKVKQIFSIMTDVTFLKPFSILLVLFAVALEWTGLPAIGFYMVPLLK